MLPHAVQHTVEEVKLKFVEVVEAQLTAEHSVDVPLPHAVQHTVEEVKIEVCRGGEAPLTAEHTVDVPLPTHHVGNGRRSRN